MLSFSWLPNWKRSAPATRRRTQPSPCQRADFRPRLEALEDRTLLSTYTAGNVRALIADINSANNAGGSNTIILAAGTSFDLKSADNTTNGANGLPVIGGAKAVDLTIFGNGDAIDRVSVTTKQGGSNAFRLFDVARGASLTLDHVTLQGGSAVGGAIYNQGTLTVRAGSTLSNNSGSGIYNAGGTVTVTNSALLGNAASYGGGIDNNGGTVTVSNSTLARNGASNGGGIYNGGGTVTVSNTMLSGNSATYGGGIYNAGGKVAVSNDSTLSGNYATPDYSGRGGYGGGIYNSGGTVMISHSILSGNSAYVFGLYGDGGGGIYNDPYGTVTVQNSSSISGNMSGFDESLSNEDVYNLGLLYLDSTSTIGVLDGNPAIPT